MFQIKNNRQKVYLCMYLVTRLISNFCVEHVLTQEHKLLLQQLDDNMPHSKHETLNRF